MSIWHPVSKTDEEIDASEWMEFLQALLDLIFVLGLFLTVTIVMLVWGIYVH